MKMSKVVICMLMGLSVGACKLGPRTTRNERIASICEALVACADIPVSQGACEFELRRDFSKEPEEDVRAIMDAHKKCEKKYQACGLIVCMGKNLNDGLRGD